jgi:hypothetical protein
MARGGGALAHREGQKLIEAAQSVVALEKALRPVLRMFLSAR